MGVNGTGPCRLGGQSRSNQRGATGDLWEQVRRGYARGEVRALVYSCESGDVVVEAPFIPKEIGSAEYESFQKGSVEG